MTPLEVAAGYTVFATGGVRAEPMFIHSVISGDGTMFENSTPRTRQAMDARTAYMVTNLLEDVINHGTAAGVRSRGFYAPAAGKTGTSHDGWFAGFTSNLLCVVWVGFDDNRELNLAGSASAAPIWAEFMKRVIALPAYRGAIEFPRPAGITTAVIDPETGQLATPDCPGTREEVFIEGTQPTAYCEKHGGLERAEAGEGGSWLSRIFGGKKKEPETTTEEQEPEETTVEAAPPEDTQPADASAPVKRPARKVQRAKAPAKQPAPQPAPAPEPQTLWQRFLGIFGGGKKAQPAPPPQPAQQNKKPPPAKQ
jgi:penicillin-binding protein 1B